MTVDITLKRATQDDLEDYLQIESSVKSALTIVTTDPEKARREIRDSVVYMVMLDDQAVGLISYDAKTSLNAHLSEIAIHPDFQGRGIGSQALSMILNELEGKGFVFVDLETHPDNPALNLYERFGFEVRDRIENYKDSGTPRLALTRNFAAQKAAS